MQGTLRHLVCMFALAVTGLLGLSPASAQLAGVSNGDLDVSVVVGARVWITRLNDIDLGTYSGSGSLTGTSRMCVYRNDSGIYNITATSSNASDGTFRAAAGGRFVPYQVGFRDRAGNTFEEIVSGQRLTGLQGQNFALLCLFVNNATLDVTFREADLQAAPAGSYQDVITLLVEPG